MVHPKLIHLSRRERQIMDVLYRVGKASVADVLRQLPDPPSYSAVRALLRILEEKGVIRHEQAGARYVFIPTVRRDAVKRSALRHLVNTFFEGSTSQVMAALVEMSGPGLDADELARLRQLIDQAKQRRKE